MPEAEEFSDTWAEVGLTRHPLCAGSGQSAAYPVSHPGGLGRIYLPGAGQSGKPRTSCPPGLCLRVCHFVVFT